MKMINNPKTKSSYQRLMMLLAVLSILLPSCLNENDNDEVADVSTSVISYQQVAVPDTAVESYILQVFDWSLTGDGNSVFEHLTQDDYFGLQAVSNSAEPLRDLRFQLAKDLENGVNFLSLDGVFEPSQILTVKLPFSMFNLDNLFVTSNEINLEDYDFFFQPADGSGQISITPTLANSNDSALVEATGTGTFVVQIRDECDDTTNNCNNLAVTLPTIPYKHYHNYSDANLRKFSWNGSLGTAECRIGNSSYDACSGSNFHTVPYTDWNPTQTLDIRVTQDNGTVLTNTINFANEPSLSSVTFHICDTPLINPASQTEIQTEISANGRVICLDSASDVDLDVSSLTISFQDIVIIGDADSKAVIRGDVDIINIAANVMSNVVLANLELKQETVADVKFGVSFGDISSANYSIPASVSQDVISNVKITSYSGGPNSATGIKASFGHHVTVLNSIIDYNDTVDSGTKEGIIAFNTTIDLIDSQIFREDIALEIENSIEIPSANFFTNIERSSLKTINSGGKTIITSGGSFTTPYLIKISDSKVSSGDSVFQSTPDYYHWSMNNTTVIRNFDEGNVVTKSIFDTGGGSNTNLSGQGNRACYENVGGQFDAVLDAGFDTDGSTVSFEPGSLTTQCNANDLF